MEHTNRDIASLLELDPGRVCPGGHHRLYFRHLWAPGLVQRIRQHPQRLFRMGGAGLRGGQGPLQAIPGPGSWLFAFVLGMAIGGFIAGRTSKEIPVRDMPPIWKKRFGDSRAKRYAATFFGGFLILFGSRLAGGCTLGLFISGSAQLAVSGLYFGVVIFAVAMLTARLIFGKTAQEEDIQ
jgi:uncharacterized membrane protein YedE/YeeE